MKILHLVWGFDVGGLESMLVDIANAQSTEHNVAILVINDEVSGFIKSLLAPNVLLFQVARPRSSRNPYFWFKLYWYILRFKPCVFHLHQVTILKLLRYFWQPKVVTVHETGVDVAAALNCNPEICAISPAVANDLVQRFPQLNLHIVQNGIPVDLIHERIWHIPKLFFNVVQIGRLDHSTKGQDILIKALSIVRKTEPRLDMRVDFIGDGSSLDFLRRLACEEGVLEYCNFLGGRSRSYIFENLKSYDLLVQPSYFEGFGLTIAEAMAAKVPTLVSDLEGPMDIIESGLLGFYFERGNYLDCARQLTSIAINYPEKVSEELLQSAKRSVTERYDVIQTALNYSNIYREITDES